MISLKKRHENTSHSAPSIALIGCGAIAETYYLPALARHPDVLRRLILVDCDEGRAQRLAARFNVQTFQTDYRPTINRVDGAIIAVPTHLHYPISMEFLSQGVPVLCEKPLAESAEKARALNDCADSSSTSLAVNYLQRLIPTFAMVKEWLVEGAWGQPLSIEYFVSEEFKWPTASGFYFNAPVSSRGVLRDRGAHVMDHICWWLGGKPRLVSSQNDAFGGSEAVAHVQFEHKQCAGRVHLSWLATLPSRFNVGCEDATIQGDVYDYQSLVVKTRDGHRQRVNLKSKAKTKVDIADEVVTNFVNVIAKGEPPLVSGSDVLDSIQFIDECYAAATRLTTPWYAIAEAVNA